jgi:DNA-binding transcriptional MerR regulator
MSGTSSKLRALAGAHDLTMEELVESAEELVREIAPKQTRYKVTERPDARTIRYYITQQLLPKPAGYDGGRARYGGSHLLRLALIKRLQAEHHTLSQIARVLDGATDAEVEEALSRAVSEPGARQTTAAKSAVSSQGVAQRSRGRIELAPGGVLEVPDDVIRDPQKRQRLAASLESIAHWLRSTGEDT